MSVGVLGLGIVATLQNGPWKYTIRVKIRFGCRWEDESVSLSVTTLVRHSSITRATMGRKRSGRRNVCCPVRRWIGLFWNIEKHREGRIRTNVQFFNNGSA